MKLFKIQNWLTGKLIFKFKCESLRVCLEIGVEQGVDFSYAKLNNAKLNNAKLNNAKLNNAKLNNAELNNAKLNYAELNYAELNNAKLNNAELNYAELNNADFDFASWPLWCGSFSANADDRLVAQLLHHVCKLNTENCSGGVQEAVEHIKDMAISDLFCEYRKEIERIKKN